MTHDRVALNEQIAFERWEGYAKPIDRGRHATRWDWFVDSDKWDRLMSIVGLDPTGLTSQEYTVNFLREDAVGGIQQ